MTQTPLAGNNFLLPNYTFFVEVVLFLIIMAVLGRFVLPRLQQVLRDRQAMVQTQLQNSEQARELLAKAQHEYENALTDARTEAAQIRENARAEVQRTMDELRSKAQEESARIVARGEAQLAEQRSAILRDLRSDLGSLAVELSEKIVGQRLRDEADVSTTVENYLAGIAADERARTGVET